MVRTRLRLVLLLSAGLVMAGATRADDDAKATKLERKPVAIPHGFLARFLAPRIDIGLNGEAQAATVLTNPGANPWTRDDYTVSRVERRTIHATSRALKNYAIEQLGINKWSVPLFGGAGTGVAALKTDSGGPRLFFGFSRFAPRAEVLIPVAAGRVAFSADAMGRIGTWFEASSSSLRFGASVDPRGHDGTLALTCRF